MQPYQNYFPTGYQPVNPYPQSYSQQQYQQGYTQAQPQAPQMQQPNNFMNNQPLTPPTIHAEIVQVDSRQVALDYPVAPGSSQMMMMKDDSAIFIKMAYANGQSQLIEYPRKIVVEEKETNVLENYVTIDMFNKKISELTEALSKQQYNSRRQNSQNQNQNQPEKKQGVNSNE